MKLRYTPRGAVDLEDILSYLAERSPQGGRNVRARIHAVANLLLQHPNAGQLTSKSGLRRIVTAPYPFVIYYRAGAETITIHAVRHGARRPTSELR